jgi:hypothetical protein
MQQPNYQPVLMVPISVDQHFGMGELLHSEFEQGLFDLLFLQVVEQWVLKTLFGFLYVAEGVLETGLDGLAEFFEHFPIEVCFIGHL